MAATQPGKSHHFRLVLAALGLIAGAVVVHGALPHWLDPGALQMPARWREISAIIFCAAVISSTVGFAFSAIAAAMILYCVPNGIEAVQIMMIASIGIQAYSVAGLSHAIRWSRCAPFVLGGIATLPIGILLLFLLNVQTCTYALAMGAVLVVYGLYMLLRRPVTIRKGDYPVTDMLVGALGGVTGPLAALPAIGVTIWCGMRGWDKVTQRAVYQPYILIMQVITLAALSLAPQQAPFDPALLVYALPGAAGAVIGVRIFHALSDLQFQRMINLALVVSGVALVLR